MAKSNPAFLAFNGGEVDKETLARADLDLYARVAETLENVLPYTQGKMAKAPGSKYIDDITALAVVTDEDGGIELDEDSDEALTEGESLGVLRPFVRSGALAYALEMSANQIRFIDNSTAAYVTITGTATTIGAWADVSAAPPTGGDPPISGGSSDVGDPFYVDVDYAWISTTEGGYNSVLP